MQKPGFAPDGVQLIRLRYTGWSKKEDIALQMVTLAIVERFSIFSLLDKAD